MPAFDNPIIFWIAVLCFNFPFSDGARRAQNGDEDCGLGVRLKTVASDLTSSVTLAREANVSPHPTRLGEDGKVERSMNFLG